MKHIDTPATIAKLSAAHVNTYDYLIFASALYGLSTTVKANQITAAEWADLPGFASAAAAANIDVYVYLVPPTEAYAPYYQPDGYNYDKWATDIATLMLSHPNVKGMVIDDFVYNTAEYWSTLTTTQKQALEAKGVNTYFTPNTDVPPDPSKPDQLVQISVTKMVAQAKAIDSAFTFMPVLYYEDYVGNGAILPDYRTIVNGVIFPYTGANNVGPGDNTTDSSKATPQGTVVGALTHCHGGNNCLQISFPFRTASTAGQYGGVSRSVAIGTGATKTLSFWEDDDFVAATSGYHMMQALVNGTVVWQKDVANTDGLWHQQTVDVTSEMAGQTTASLTFRVYEQKGVSSFHVAAFIDDISGTGFTVNDPGFENPTLANWTAVSNTLNFTETVVSNMHTDFMTYTQKFSNETSPTSAAYVTAVLDQVSTMIKNGVMDGSVTYCLNLTGTTLNGTSDPATYTSVQTAYGALAG
ncbi:hypothetical protein GCM10028798_35610 [Humibacter antri]